MVNIRQSCMVNIRQSCIVNIRQSSMVNIRQSCMVNIRQSCGQLSRADEISVISLSWSILLVHVLQTNRLFIA
jgi:hypothetical protein